jgi:hypothetical protein
MPEVCKTWLKDESTFQPLCNNVFEPKTGTNECPICLTPSVLAPPLNCAGCANIEFPSSYKIVTPFLMSGDSGGIASETIETGSYISTAEVFNGGFSWNDLKSLWNKNLVRNEGSTPLSCGTPSCYWAISAEKIIFAISSTFGVRQITGQPIQTKSSTKTNQSTSATVNFPVRAKKYVGYGPGGYTTCEILSIPNSSTGIGMAPAYLMQSGQYSPPLPMTQPDLSLTWPAGFGTLSGTKIVTVSGNTAGGFTGGRYWPDLPHSPANSYSGSAALASIAIILSAANNGMFTLKIVCDGRTVPVDGDSFNGYAQSWVTGSVPEAKLVSARGHHCNLTLFSKSLNRYVGRTYDNLQIRPIKHTAFWPDVNAPVEATYTGFCSCSSPETLKLDLVSGGTSNPTPYQYFPATITLKGV